MCKTVILDIMTFLLSTNHDLGTLLGDVLSYHEEGCLYLMFLEHIKHVIKSIKCVKLYSTFYISYTIRTNGLLYLTGHNECPLLTILLT